MKDSEAAAAAAEEAAEQVAGVVRDIKDIMSRGQLCFLSSYFQSALDDATHTDSRLISYKRWQIRITHPWPWTTCI